jgi:RecT family
MPGTDLTTLDPTDLVARVSEGALKPSEQALLNRLVKIRQGQTPPTREELALVVSEAFHLGLDPFAKQVYFIRFDDGPGGAWECFPHWSGLVKIAEETGEYLGHRGPFYSADGKEWSRAWLPDTAPPFCMVTVLRRDHEPTTAVVKFKRHARMYFNQKQGKKVLMPQWESNPEEMLGKAALRLALRRAFPKEADRGLSKAQLRALHTLAAMKGLGGTEKRPERLAEVSEIVGRPVASLTDLSVAEASEVYETMAEELGEILPDDAVFDSGGADGADVVGGAAAAPQAGDSPTAAPSAPDDPQELAELRKRAVDEFRTLSSMLPGEWRPWFRNNVEEIRPGAWEEWPKSFNIAELKELFARLERVRPWGEPEQTS